MARFKYGPLVTQISGSVGGLTFQRSAYGNTLRSKPIPIHSKTPSQLERRAYMHSLQYAWNALTYNDRKKWKQFIAYSGQSINADQNVLISGYNLFLKYQFCRLMYGIDLLVNFTYIPIPAWPASFIVYADSNQLYAQFYTTLQPSEYFFILCLSNSRQPSNSYSPVNCRFMFCNQTESNIFTFTSSYQKNFGLLPISGDTLHFSIYYFSLKAPLLSGFRTGKLVIGTPVTHNWVDVASTALTGYTAIAYGNGLFIAITDNIGGINYTTSPDGETWTYRASGINGIMSAICYNGTYWIIVTMEGVDHTAYSSANGINWTAMDAISNLAWGCIASNGTKAIAISRSPGFPVIGNSIASNSLTYVEFPFYASFRGICFGAGLWVAVSDTDPTHYVLYSINGDDWFTAFETPAYGWSCVAFGNGVFVAGNQRTDGNNFATSSNGINWVISDSAPFGPIYAITFANSRFVAIGNCLTGSFALTSIDGLNWILEPLPVSATFYGVASNGTLFVAVSNTTPAIILSD